MPYHELWPILSNWRSEFTTEEFARTFSSPDPRKVLHDMAGLGFLEHLAYGRYKVNTPEEYVRLKNNVADGYELLRTSELPYALTGVDGVFLWTKGGYNLDRFFGFYPIHLKIRMRDSENWKRFFWKNNRKVFLENEEPRETLYGVFYVLHPRLEVEVEHVDGLSVEPLSETLEFCLENKYAFEPALRMLEERRRTSANRTCG